MEITMPIILSILTTTVTGIIGWLFHKIKKREEERLLAEKNRIKSKTIYEQAIGNALRALCRDRILQGYIYYRQKNSIAPQELETMNKLYEAYHALGGNGTITSVFERITELPIKKE